MSQRYDRVSAFEVASFKAVDAAVGEFEALVSVFGNVDLIRDRVVKGAFTKSLAQWQEKGDPIPVIWNHMWENPEAHIGAIAPGDAAETDDGLVVKGRLDLDNPFAKQVYRLLAERRVKEFSFGYKIVDAEKAKDGALDLLELDLFEVGPTLKGMNPATELMAVKALADATLPETRAALTEVDTFVDTMNALRPLVEPDSTKAGARHSKATLTLVRQHIDALEAHFFAGDPGDSPKSDEAEAQGKASDPDEDIDIDIQLLKGQLRGN